LEAETGTSVEDLLSLAQLESIKIAQTALTTLMILCGLALVIFVEPPTSYFVGGDDYSGDWRPTILVIALLIVFIMILLVPSLRNFFDLALLSPLDYALIATVAIVWSLMLRYIWRAQWFDRFLNLPIKRSILAQTLS
jgi:cation-transporting ATPase E